MSGSALLLATRNAGKAREFRELLAGLPLTLRDLRDFPDAPDVPEPHGTYAGNARDKALALARLSGLPTLADDSGLEVDALAGAPGVRSARFAGEGASDQDNTALLLARLREIPESSRTARFRCVLVVAHPDGRLLQAEGTCEGRIAVEPRGTNGFGYDPIFVYPPAGVTFGEMDAGEKQRVSHRAAACAALRPRLGGFLGIPPSRRDLC